MGRLVACTLTGREAEKWIQQLLLLFGKVNEVAHKESDKSGEVKFKKKGIFLKKEIDLSLCKFNRVIMWPRVGRRDKQINLEDQRIMIVIKVITRYFICGHCRPDHFTLLPWGCLVWPNDFKCEFKYLLNEGRRVAQGQERVGHAPWREAVVPLGGVGGPSPPDERGAVWVVLILIVLT